MTEEKKTIPGWLLSRVSQADFEKVEEAVHQAELKTTGEIVPVIVKRSSTVGHIPLVLFLILMFGYILLGVSEVLDVPILDSLWLNLMVFAVVLVASRFLAQFEFFERILTPKIDQQKQVEQRAELEFYESSIKSTENGTGILLFLSLMERQAIVLADRGISEHYPPETWQKVVNLMLDGIKQGNMATGISHGVEECGNLLAAKLPKPEGNPNELPNHLVIKEF